MIIIYTTTVYSLAFQHFLVLKRAKKSKNDLINAEEGEDHFTDISSVGKFQARCLCPLNSRWTFSQNQHRKWGKKQIQQIQINVS